MIETVNSHARNGDNHGVIVIAMEEMLISMDAIVIIMVIYDSRGNTSIVMSATSK